MVTIDPTRRRATVLAGAVWRDVADAAAAHGLVPVAGAPDADVVQTILDGGIGWLSRRFGLACNAVTAIERFGEPVDPGGDLFWALRGGGGAGLGAVTAVELELHPIGAVHVAALEWPEEAAAGVLERWCAWTQGLPDELASAVQRSEQTVRVQALHLGSASESDELIAPLRDLEPAHERVIAGPPAALPGLADPVPVATPALPPGGELRHLGGALASAPPNAGALARIDAPYALAVPRRSPLSFAAERRLAAVRAAASARQAASETVRS